MLYLSNLAELTQQGNQDSYRFKKCEYLLFSLNLLTSYFNGEMQEAISLTLPELDIELVYHLGAFRERFVPSMVYFKDDLEIFFTLRVLKYKNERISTTPVDERGMDQFINEFDFRRIAAFVNDRKPNIELVNHLLREFGMLYFGGRLPFHMNEDEEKILILMGLLSFSIQDVKEKLNLRNSELNLHLKSMYGKLLEYYYILFPQY
ncbi:hypothetical protein E5676_scaffold289G00850 [Cucumis melo var. makuwa]|uniref:Possible tRNA binding domain-containing protein n=1 Tax=Cucumis melo var. makuwa TaxID=1194695 RepID=A0A5D3DY49_CUCMM|nr:hypothetical protein E5676_scaffold289G00850 [Cucumis melo var. makuwa]